MVVAKKKLTLSKIKKLRESEGEDSTAFREALYQYMQRRDVPPDKIGEEIGVQGSKIKSWISDFDPKIERNPSANSTGAGEGHDRNRQRQNDVDASRFFKTISHATTHGGGKSSRGESSEELLSVESQNGADKTSRPLISSSLPNDRLQSVPDSSAAPAMALAGRKHVTIALAAPKTNLMSNCERSDMHISIAEQALLDENKRLSSRIVELETTLATRDRVIAQQAQKLKTYYSICELVRTEWSTDLPSPTRSTDFLASGNLNGVSPERENLKDDVAEHQGIAHTNPANLVAEHSYASGEHGSVRAPPPPERAGTRESSAHESSTSSSSKRGTTKPVALHIHSPSLSDASRASVVAEPCGLPSVSTPCLSKSATPSTPLPTEGRSVATVHSTPRKTSMRKHAIAAPPPQVDSARLKKLSTTLMSLSHKDVGHLRKRRKISENGMRLAPNSSGAHISPLSDHVRTADHKSVHVLGAASGDADGGFKSSRSEPLLPESGSTWAATLHAHMFFTLRFDHKQDLACEANILRSGLSFFRDSAMVPGTLNLKYRVGRGVVSEITDFPYTAEEASRWGRNICDVLNGLRERATRFSFQLSRAPDSSGDFVLPQPIHSDEFWLRDSSKFSRNEFNDAFNKLKRWHTEGLDKLTLEQCPQRERFIDGKRTFLKTTYASVVLNGDTAGWQRAHFDLSNIIHGARPHRCYSSFLSLSPRGNACFYTNQSMERHMLPPDDELSGHFMSFCALSGLHSGARGLPGAFLFTMDEVVTSDSDLRIYNSNTERTQTLPPLCKKDMCVTEADDTINIVRKLPNGAYELVEDLEDEDSGDDMHESDDSFEMSDDGSADGESSDHDNDTVDELKGDPFEGWVRRSSRLAVTSAENNRLKESQDCDLFTMRKWLQALCDLDERTRAAAMKDSGE